MALGAGGDEGYATTLNVDDVRETLRLVFGGDEPTTLQRASPGTEGTPCKVVVNVYPATLPRGHVYHYDVEICSKKRVPSATLSSLPAEKRARCASKLVNRKVIDAFTRNYRVQLEECLVAFDGRKNMYTRRRLSHYKKTFENVEAEVNGEKQLFDVQIAYVGVISFDSIHAFYEGNGGPPSEFQEPLQVADIILRTRPTMDFVPVGRSFFEEPERGRKINLTGMREAWFGFYSSVRLGVWKPMVNIDMSATAFFVAAPILDYAVDVLRKKSRADLGAGISDRERIVLTRELRTLRVTVTHISSKRQHRIEKLRQRPANEDTFEYEGRAITVAQYFVERHNRQLEFPNLPCISTGNGRVFLPLEVCNLVRGQHCRKKLNELQTSNMIRQTALSPKDRFERISKSMELLKSRSAQICAEFDMDVASKPLEVEARILRPPVITHGAKKKQLPTDGVWRCDSFLKPAKMRKWALAVLGRIGEEKAGQITQLFQLEGAKLGMKIARPSLTNFYGPQARTRNVLEDIKNKHPDVEMTLVVLDPKSDYGALKADAECSDLSMRTQCVKDRNIQTKFNPMFASNLLQKINTKLGGSNNGILLQNPPNTLKRPFMMIGVDVNHAAPGETAPSIAAMVASMDSTLVQYYACTSVQLGGKGPRTEIVAETESMLRECLEEFQTRNKILPQHLFIFRDGVAEAQFDAVRMYELGALRKACLNVRSDYTPGMTFMIVQKRHRVRFMPTGGDRGFGRTGNIHAGTIIDSKIVNPAIFDFYLCSHQGIQGSSRAAHYHVVHDDAEHSPDDIYRLCYGLCHTYARCARAVSIPAPVYYAHLAAFRAREHLKGRGQVDGSSSASMSGSARSFDLSGLQTAQSVSKRMKGSMYFV